METARHRFRLADFVQGRFAFLLPEIARRHQETSQVARRRVHAPQLSEEFGRVSRRAVVHDQEGAVSGGNREVTVDQTQAFVDGRMSFGRGTENGNT